MKEIKIERKELKKLIKELEKYRGRHTELISISVPSGYNINEIGTLVKQEQGTASNIKSTATRKNVLGALARVDHFLKSVKQTPRNGLCIYCGNISDKEGEGNIKIWTFEPPEPINLRTYRCDQSFILNHLKELVEEKEVYGLLTIDRAEASVAFLIGKAVQIQHHFDSLVPGKTGKGGQSAQRFERVRAGLLLNFLKQVGEAATKTFESNKYLKGIILGGPGPTKDMFMEGNFLSEAMKNKVLGVKDLSYAGNEGLFELVERSEDILKESKVKEERDLLIEFLDHLKKDDGLSIYGFAEVREALTAGAVKRLIISEDFPMKHHVVECPKCSIKKDVVSLEQNLQKKCEKCGNSLKIEEKDDLIEKINELAEKMKTEIKEVSSDTPEGAQFLQLGGIGAILRYKIS